VKAITDLLFTAAATTGGITVRTGVSYLPEQSSPRAGRWFWAYHIRIENNSARAVKLMTRRWVITDGRGARSLVEGEGVIGEQPLLPPGQSYDYVSGCPLSTPLGRMEGSYGLVDDEGGTLSVTIPRFELVAPEEARNGDVAG